MTIIKKIIQWFREDEHGDDCRWDFLVVLLAILFMIIFVTVGLIISGKISLNKN